MRKLKREFQTQEPALNRMRQSLNAQGFSTQNFSNNDRRPRRRMDETARKIKINIGKSALYSGGGKNDFAHTDKSVAR